VNKTITTSHNGWTRKWGAAHLSRINEQLPKWSLDSGIDQKLWYIRNPKPKTLTKVGPDGVWGDPEDKEQAIHIQRSGDLNPTPLAHYPSSLMSVLSNYALYSIRIYVTLPHGINRSVVDFLERTIRNDLPDLPWK